MGVNHTVSQAANIRWGENPPYALDGFRTLYPQFAEVPDEVLLTYIQFASDSLSYQRYTSAWTMLVGLFTAHFASLWQQQSLGEQGQAVATGLINTMSVGGVSVGFDNSGATQDLEGWAAWKTTTYGQQFATLAKPYNIGGMVIR